MRFLQIAATVTLISALVVTPLAAHADASTGTCEVGLELPKRLSITAYSTPYGARVTGERDCYSRVAWDLSRGLISTGRTIAFFRPATSGFQSYAGGPATVHALPALGAYSLDQYTDPQTGAKRAVKVVETASGSMTVKYDSRIAWRKPRALPKGQMLLRASAASISESTVIFGNYAAWTGERVRFQRKQAGVWRTVLTGRTDNEGNVQVRTRLVRGEWRVQSIDTSTTWGRASSSHRI